MIELLVVLLVAMVMGGMAIPAARTAMASYQLNSAVDSATGAIEGARYQAIMHGYPYEVTFNPTQNTVQVLNEVPPATSFSNVGSSVPLSNSPITFSAATTLLCKSNGSISATVGAMSFAISYNNTTKTVTVSKYGSINVQ
jgi:Tfp pilus assembly protein FimT